MSLFEKCYGYTTAREVQATGFYPYFRAIEESYDTEVVVEGHRKVMVGSNNYLGLTHHPRVIEAAEAGLRRFGSGCTGSRFLNGTLDLHERLEHELAAFLNKESALVFSTGFQTNLGVIATLVGRNDHIFSDKLNHASIIDGSRLSYGTAHRYTHSDMEGLERQLQKVPGDVGKLIVTDGIFSMEGDIANLPAITSLAEVHGAKVLVDDAHAFGVLCARGAGTAELPRLHEVSLDGGVLLAALWFWDLSWLGLLVLAALVGAFELYVNRVANDGPGPEAVEDAAP